MVSALPTRSGTIRPAADPPVFLQGFFPAGRHFQIFF
jgi:hypothetical protein